MAIGNRIKSLRESAGFSQAELARKLEVSPSIVKTWEMGISAPAALYIIEMAKLFHSTADYILELDKGEKIVLDGYCKDEIRIIRNLLSYFDKQN